VTLSGTWTKPNADDTSRMRPGLYTSDAAGAEARDISRAEERWTSGRPTKRKDHSARKQPWWPIPDGGGGGSVVCSPLMSGWLTWFTFFFARLAGTRRRPYTKARRRLSTSVRPTHAPLCDPLPAGYYGFNVRPCMYARRQQSIMLSRPGRSSDQKSCSIVASNAINCLAIRTDVMPIPAGVEENLLKPYIVDNRIID